MRKMSREEAAAALRECRCRRWITTPTCDHCWVDAHRCPPTVEQALGLLARAIQLGSEAETLAAKLRLVGPR